MKKGLTAIIAVAACAGGAAAHPVAAPTGTWAGTAQLRTPGGPESYAISVELTRRRAVVSLAAGHPARTVVPARVAGNRIRFSLPGRPGLVFDGRLKRGRLSGTFRQGALRGRFALRRGRPIEGSSIALYRFADGSPLGVVAGFGQRATLRYDTDEIRGLYLTRPGTYAVGAGLATRNPIAGTTVFRPDHVAGPSQAGWTMPLAAVREPAIRFVIGLVSPTVTQGETDLWSTLNDQGWSLPTRTDEDMEAEVRRAGRSGFDPMPSIRAMRIPAVWLYGGKDRTVPSRLCVERLDPVASEAGRDFTYRVFPGGTHGLILTANGVQAEEAASNRFVAGLYPAIRDWLRARGLAP